VRAYVHACGDASAEAFRAACESVARETGFTAVDRPDDADVAIAPMLSRKLSRAQYEAPRCGTLVFHPSALPYRRGPDAIRHAVAAGERVSASTWFWCSEGLDEGDVCEQEVVVLRPGESAGRAYHTRFVPAGLRALRRALEGVVAGTPRRATQDPSLATYDRRFVQGAA
jgi:methionyl-tRNA formyltransferase